MTAATPSGAAATEQSAAIPGNEGAAFVAVEAVLRGYFDGLHHADPARLEPVFHPEAIYATATGGTLLHRRVPEYLADVAQRESPASRGEPRADAVDAITFAGPETALARVRCAIGERRFVDLLTLVLVDGRWQIIAKVFHYEIEEGD